MTVDEDELIEVLQEYFSGLLKAKQNVVRYVVGEFQRIYRAKDENLNYEKELSAQLAKLQKTRQKYMDMYADDLISREELKEMEPDIVAFSELGSYIDMPIRTYSSGMKSKLGFSINANIRPDIIIVDEALSVGDKDFRAKCRRRIAEILNSGVTFLFVTHSTAEAKNFCKRGLVIREGKLVFDGDIKDAAAFYEKMHV